MTVFPWDWQSWGKFLYLTQKNMWKTTKNTKKHQKVLNCTQFSVPDFLPLLLTSGLILSTKMALPDPVRATKIFGFPWVPSHNWWNAVDRNFSINFFFLERYKAHNPATFSPKFLYISSRTDIGSIFFQRNFSGIFSTVGSNLTFFFFFFFYKTPIWVVRTPWVGQNRVSQKCANGSDTGCETVYNVQIWVPSQDPLGRFFWPKPCFLPIFT